MPNKPIAETHFAAFIKRATALEKAKLYEKIMNEVLKEQLQTIARVKENLCQK